MHVAQTAHGTEAVGRFLMVGSRKDVRVFAENGN